MGNRERPALPAASWTPGLAYTGQGLLSEVVTLRGARRAGRLAPVTAASAVLDSWLMADGGHAACCQWALGSRQSPITVATLTATRSTTLKHVLCSPALNGGDHGSLCSSWQSTCVAGARCVRHRCVVPQPLPLPLPFPQVFDACVSPAGDVPGMSSSAGDGARPAWPPPSHPPDAVSKALWDPLFRQAPSMQELAMAFSTVPPVGPPGTETCFPCLF